MVRDLTQGQPLKRILAFMLPLLIGNLFQQFYSMADSIIVGQFLGVDAFAAVGSTGSISFLILGFAQGVCSGFAIPVAQEFGAGDMGKMRRCVANTALLATGIALFITVATALLTRHILQWMNTPANIFEDAYRYIFIVFAGTGATMLYNMLACILRALGDSRTPLIYLAIASFLNIALDLLFIAVIPMGVAGAAYATVAAQAISGALCLIHICRKFSILRISREEWRPNREICGRLLGAGVPMGLQFSITAIGSINLQTAVNALGSGSVAAVSAGSKVQMILTTPLEAMGATMATYCGQNRGANRIDRVHSGVKQITAARALYCVVGLVLARYTGSYIALLFVGPQETLVLAQVRQLLTVNGLFYIPLMIILVYRNALQGMGFSNSAMLAGVCELAARSLVAWFLVPPFGFDGVCFANPAAWVAADLLLLPLYATKVHRLLRWEAARIRLEQMTAALEGGKPHA